MDWPKLPAVTEVEGLREVIGPPRIIVHEGEKDGVGTLGFVFECAWDQEHGLAVVVHKGEVLKTGDKAVAFYGPFGDGP